MGSAPSAEAPTVIRPSAATLAFEESLKVVTTVKSRKDFTTYVPRDGISLDFLLQHLGDTKNLPSSYDLEAYVQQLTQKWNCSFTELLNAHPKHKRAVRNKADVFVSFAYTTDLESILSALDRFRKREGGTKDIFVWISIFSINQHFGRSDEERQSAPVVYPQGWFKNAFKKCISSIQKVLLVMSPLATPVALQRLWCIYELYLAISDEKCKLDVVLSEEDERYLIRDLAKTSENILGYILKVDSKSAKSANPSHEQKLREEISKVGYDAIDGVIRDRLREWLEQTAATRIANRKEVYKKQDMKKYISLLGMVSRMFHESGRHEEAASFASEALELTRHFYGNEHDKTFTAICKTAVEWTKQREYDKAEALLEEALRLSSKLYGKQHLHYATSLHNLAALLNKQGKLKEAKPLFEESLRIYRKNIGFFRQNELSVANTLNSLGLLLINQGDHENAEKLLEEAREIRTRKLGSEHPTVAASLNALATLRRRQHRYDEAEPLLEEVLVILEKSVGKQHSHYTYALDKLASVFKAQGKLDKAKASYEELLSIRIEELGAKHRLVVQTLEDIANVLELQGKSREAKKVLKRIKM